MNTKKQVKGIIGLTGVSLGLGLGSEVVGAVGGNAAGLGVASSFLPVGGALLGISMGLDALKDLQKSAGIKYNNKNPKVRLW